MRRDHVLSSLSLIWSVKDFGARLIFGSAMTKLGSYFLWTTRQMRIKTLTENYASSDTDCRVMKDDFFSAAAAADDDDV